MIHYSDSYLMAQTKKTLINEELQKAWSKICYCCSCSDVDYPTKELDMISDVLIAYEELQAISDKTSDKYRWHDLRKNPDDLPEDYTSVLICFKGFEGRKAGVEIALHNRKNGLWGTSSSKFEDEDVIAWREIEPFEVEE